VSPEKRGALVDLAAAKLKPGGILTVSYNAMPGWAAVEPLRRLMLDSAGGGKGTSLDRARHGLTAAKVLNDAGADYFVQNPSARSMLEAMQKGGLQYVAHEYFHTHWHPMYFADVAAEMAARGLYFIGELPLYANYKDLTIPPSLVELFKGITDRIVLERMKDFAVNEFFRRDIYVKGRATCSPANARAYFESTPFGAPAGRILREVRLPHYTLQFAGEVFDALVPALCERASTVAELAQREELAPFGAATLREAILRLALGDQVVPTLASTAPVSVEGAASRRYRVPLAYNRMALAQRLSQHNPIVLASRVTGTGLTLSMLHTACLHVLTEVEPAECAAWIRTFVAEQPLKLHDKDRPITDKAEQASVLEQQLAEFAEKRVPELLRLGILDEA
jgi:hypothetical protein